MVAARDLKKADFKVVGKGKSDPYCKIYSEWSPPARAVVGAVRDWVYVRSRPFGDSADGESTCYVMRRVGDNFARFARHEISVSERCG